MPVAAPQRLRRVLLRFQIPKLMSTVPCLHRSKGSVPVPSGYVAFRNMLLQRTVPSTLTLKASPLSTVRGCLFNALTATLNIRLLMDRRIDGPHRKSGIPASSWNETPVLQSAGPAAQPLYWRSLGATFRSLWEIYKMSLRLRHICVRPPKATRQALNGCSLTSVDIFHFFKITYIPARVKGCVCVCVYIYICRSEKYLEQSCREKMNMFIRHIFSVSLLVFEILNKNYYYSSQL
jgi:hypothetical protein